MALLNCKPIVNDITDRDTMRQFIFEFVDRDDEEDDEDMLLFLLDFFRSKLNANEIIENNTKAEGALIMNISGEDCRRVTTNLALPARSLLLRKNNGRFYGDDINRT